MRIISSKNSKNRNVSLETVNAQQLGLYVTLKAFCQRLDKQLCSEPQTRRQFKFI